jgi:hypothetical protein
MTAKQLPGSLYAPDGSLYITLTDGAGNLAPSSSGGTGTVTSVSVVNANGVSGTVATASTTPAITLSLGAITPTTVNGLSITSLAPLASPTLTGTPTAPTAAAGDNTTQIATDAFVTTAVNNAIAAVNPAVAVQAATTQASDTSGLTYLNGASGIGATFTGSVSTAITIDGFTFTTLGQRLLIKNDTQSPSGSKNGIYYVTQLQTGLLAPILTRALDYDQPSDMNNTGAIPVVNGTVNAATSWLLTSTVATVGTDPLTFIQFSVNPAPLAGSTSATSWTPTDQSGASLTFTSVNAQYTRIGNIVFAYGALTYPSTTSPSNASISLPVAVPNQSYAVVFSNKIGNNVQQVLKTVQNTTTATVILNNTGAAVTNSTLSASVLNMFISYPAT